MQDANSRQVGGNHYKGADYQHWDWVHDCRLHYLAGTASKYIARNRKKNGLEDLEKALHYIHKAEEKGVTSSTQLRRHEYFWRFVQENELTLAEAEICWLIMEGDWATARVAVSSLLDRDPSGRP